METQTIQNGRAILLEIMSDPKYLLPAKQHIKETDFQAGVDRDCWKRILALESQGKPYDQYQVCNPDHAGSISELSIRDWMPDVDLYGSKLEFFEQRVIDFVNRVDRDNAKKALRVFERKIDSGELIDSQQIGDKLNDLAQKMYAQHPVNNQEYAGAYAMQDMKELADNVKSGIPFGLEALDEELGGMTKGQFIVIAGRPGAGKSSIYLYPAIQFCKRNRHVLIDTIEMTRAEVLLRFIANKSGVVMGKIVGKYSSDIAEAELIGSAVDEIKAMKLTIADKGLVTIPKIDNYLCKKEAEHDPVELLVIDHFGLLQPDSGYSKNRYTDYTNISNSLKQLAKHHNLVIIGLAQLNRIDEFTKPSMENLRDTGSLEQDADKIIVLWKEKDQKELINVACIKNRQGRTFSASLDFDAGRMQFR